LVQSQSTQLDTTPPTVSITTPTNNATISGSSVTVSANASDNVGVAGVQFLLDGANLGTEDTSSSYSITWNTLSPVIPNGPHTLTARARDAAGNQTTSAPVSVTVSNAQTGGVVHPNLFLNQKEIDELILVLDKPTTLSYLQASIDKERAVANGTVAPNQAVYGNSAISNFSPSIYTTDISGDGKVDWHDRWLVEDKDGNRAASGALAYAVYKNDGIHVDRLEYARGVRALLLSWTNATVGGGRDHGLADTGFIHMAFAYDMIYNSGVLSTSEKTTIENWFKNVAAPLSGSFPNMCDSIWYPTSETSYAFLGCYNNEIATINSLYGAVGFVTGDQTRINWATKGVWPHYEYYPPNNLTSPSYNPLTAINPRSLREFIRGGISRNMTRIANKHTDSYFPVSGNPTDVFGPRLQIVPDYYGQTIPNGTLPDYWTRGPKPCPYIKADGTAYPAFDCGPNHEYSEGQGQSYTFATLTSMNDLASMAWHNGDDIFHWQADNGNMIRSASDFARTWATHSNWPQNGSWNQTWVYELIYSYYRDPVDLALMNVNGRATGRSALYGYANRSGAVILPTDTTPPTVSITSPSFGALVSGTQTITTNSSDNIGVTKVEFFTELGKLGETLTSPFSFVWNTPSPVIPNGSHSLTAKAWDAALNNTTSAPPVSVTVGNQASGQKNIFTRRYVHMPIRLSTTIPADIDRIIGIMERARIAGYNGFLIGDTGSGCYASTYFSNECKANMQRIKDKADSFGAVIIPDYFGNYSYPAYEDGNLSEALPVTGGGGTRFLVSGSIATAVSDPAPIVPNAGFESWTSNTNVNGWWADRLGQLTFRDTSVFHSGGSSIRVDNPSVNADVYGQARVAVLDNAPITVTPYRAYRACAWLKTNNYTDTSKVKFYIRGKTIGRDLQNIADGIKPAATQDWKQHCVTFNSLEQNALTIYLFASSKTGTGSLWWDDVSLTEIGLSDTIRRASIPVIVKSLDGATSYTEGSDYVVGTEQLTIPSGSRITTGQSLRVSWWQAAHFLGKWNWGRNGSMCQPKTIEIETRVANQIYNRWRDPNGDGVGISPKTFFMGFDEWVNANWDPLCGSMSNYPNGRAGEYLANAELAAENILNSIDPKMEKYIWNDMFDPYHNARDIYQSINGSLRTPVASWSKIPTDTVIFNWYSNNSTNNLKFWSGLDSTYPITHHKQIIAGYYDTINNVSGWLNLLTQAEQQGVTDVIGFMYTTWQNGLDGKYGKYEDLEAAANIIKTSGRWGIGPVPFEPSSTDTTPPTVSITTPTNNATISGSTVIVSANASDPTVVGQVTSGVAGVQFLLDGANLGTEDTSSPYSITWNTLSPLIPNGPHTLTARARDAAGLQTISSPVNVTVSNAASLFTITSGPTSLNITQTSADITWSLSANATGVVDYGLTTAYGQSTTVENSYTWSTHSQNIPGPNPPLQPNTTYHYRVRSTNASGNSVTSGDNTFTTSAAIVVPPPADTTAPVFSNIAASNITTNSATIAWDISEKATGQVEYGLTTAYGQLSTPETSFNYQNHSQTITGLSSNSTYNYRVISGDAAGNIATSLNRTFQTQQIPDTQVPIGVTNLTGSGVTQVSFTISWPAPQDQPSGGQVSSYDIRYATTPLSEATWVSATQVSGEPSALAPGTQQSYTLAGLTPGTTYYVGMKSQDSSGNISVISNIVSQTTQSAPVQSPTFSLSNSGAKSVTVGNSITNLITTTLISGLAQQVTFSASGIPSGTTATFLPTNCLPNCSSTLTITTTSSAVAGSYPITVTGSSGAVTASTSFILTVTQAPDITAPTVAITAPAAGSSLVTNSTLTITADAQDPEIIGQVTSGIAGVQFLINGASLNSEDITSPYSTIWMPTTAGTYSLSARARDGAGKQTTSSAVSIIVTAPSLTDTTPPIISAIASTRTANSATITWTTNEPATSQVNYGSTSSYGSSSSLDTSLVQNHSVTISNLSRKTSYHFQVVSKDGAGNIANSIDQTFTTTARLTKTPKITNVSATAGSVVLAWTNPTDYEFFSGVLILKNTASELLTPDTTHQLTKINNTTYRDTAVNPGTTYYYTFFAYDDEGTYSDPVSVSYTVPVPASSGGGGGLPAQAGGGGGGTFADTTPPATPKNLRIFGGPNQIVLDWSNPTDSDFVRSILIRKEGSSPSSRTDGTKLYEGTATQFTDTTAQAGKIYYYGLFAFDQNVNYSIPATGSAYLGKNTEAEIIVARVIKPVPLETQCIPIQTEGVSITRPLYIGAARGNDVTALQTYLKKLGFFPSSEETTTFFGSITREAVRKFQCVRLNVCSGTESSTGYGSVGPGTRKALLARSATSCETPLVVGSPIQPTAGVSITRWLIVGSTGEDVKALQQFLKQKGHFPQTQETTTFFGSVTREALRTFQCSTLQVCSGDEGSTGWGATGPRTRGALKQ
jgi:hypothetical protein